MKKEKVKQNTLIQKRIRQKKKKKGLITVTLELNKKQYKTLQYISEFLGQGEVNPGQKKVIKTYSEILSYIMENYKSQIPEKLFSRVFYRQCSIAQFYKHKKGLSNKDIINELNSLNIERNNIITSLINPEFYLENKLYGETKLSKKWNTTNLKKALDRDFVTKNIKQLNSLIKSKK